MNSANVAGGETTGRDNSSERFEVRTTSDSHFSWLRTRLSLERTMMSWLRTAVSLIGFGFAIVQFFERLQVMPGTRAATYPKAPQYLGLALISCGILALIVSIWQYRWTVGYMWGPPFRSIAGMRAGVTKEKMQSPVIAIAVLLTCIGLFAFFAVLLRQV
jgi:putative membrane protein